jgi:hypothetical protein
MPYDGSGNFTRNYNWVADKNAAIKIQATRMDGEFDNYATALNQVVMRSGITPFTGPIKMGGNTIIGVGSGIVSSPGIQFNVDATSGIYAPSAGTVGLVAGGVERLLANGGQVTITGDGKITGNLGVGMTPVPSTSSPLQVAADLSLISAVNIGVGYNSYFSGGGYKYGAAGYAGGVRFDPTTGVTQWWNTAATGGAAGAATFAERMRISPAGFVGIGASAPDSPLTLQESGGTQQSFKNAAGVSRGYVGTIAALGVSAADTLRIRGDIAVDLGAGTGGTSSIHIDASGRVGIGPNFVALPGADLHVKGATNGGIISEGPAGYGSFSTKSSGSNSSYIFMNNGNGEQSRIASSDGGILLFARGSGAVESMRIDGAGNVGIGTTSPQPSGGGGGGSLTLNTLGSSIFLPIQVNGVTKGQLQADAGAFYVLGVGATPVIHYTNGAERLRISAAGNVGINVANPDTYGKLAVFAGGGGVTAIEAIGGNSGSTLGFCAVFSDTGTSQGANIRFDGNGGGAASKSIRVANGQMDIINSAYTQALLSVTDTGDVFLPFPPMPGSPNSVGFRGVPISGSGGAGSYTCVGTDAGKFIFMDGANVSCTIPGAGTVNYPLGTTLTIYNNNATNCSIICSDNLRMANSLTDGSPRTLGPHCVMTAVKILSNWWLVSGAGLS